MKQLIAAAFAASLITGAGATEIVYTPVNPSFGGNPLNGSFLLGNAQLQDNYKDPDAKDLNAQKSDLDQFNDLLQRSILNRIASVASGSLVDSTGKLIETHQEFQDFTIDVVPLGGGKVQITTTDKVTGASTTVELQQ